MVGRAELLSAIFFILSFTAYEKSKLHNNSKTSIISAPLTKWPTMFVFFPPHSERGFMAVREFVPSRGVHAM